MMQGVIDFLLGDTKDARILRKNFIFRIVPMLNPDGVIYGNCRCSLLGIDLNRRWKNPDEIMHPTIFYTKKMIEKFNKCHEVVMYCDMHGHSLKKNVFMYACSPNQSKKKKVLMSMIPYFLSKTNKLFSFQGTKFRTERFKQGAARVVVYKEFGIVNSYTLEASFFGPDNKDMLKASEEEENDDTHMNIDHLQSLGRDLCKQLLMFRTQGLFKKKMDIVVNNLQKQQRHHQEAIVQEIVQEVEAEEDEFTILNSLQHINEEDFRELFADLDEGSLSEDSGDSDIDDKKQKFLISKMNKFKKPQPLLAKTQKITRDTRYCKSPELGMKFNRESPMRRTSYSKTTIQKKPSTPEIRKVAVVAKSYLIKDYLEYRVPTKKLDEASHTQSSFSHYSNRLNSSRSLQRSIKDNPQGISKSNRSLKLVTISPFKERRKLMIIDPPKNFLI
ncbi:unnamed protein product [Blepharisma stoltei]|uniref:Peptidase M14 domain-containing protein n=1 Tax=Blepharisma stoltei TaxID=1481888 RepID=A0AAU9KMQ7_9CILI|nr:unnamed protein product [Blepharisma stoltei]